MHSAPAVQTLHGALSLTALWGKLRVMLAPLTRGEQLRK